MSELCLIEPGPACVPYGAILKDMMDGQEYPEPILFDAEFAMLQVYKGAWQLWFVFEPGERPTMFMLTTIDTFPGGKSCTIVLVGGENFFRYAANQDKFENWCRHEGVRVIYTNTPDPIARRSQRYGYKLAHRVVYKELEALQ